MKTKDSHPKIKIKSSLKAIDKAIKKAKDHTSMLQKVMNIVLDTYDSDRAYILYPCNPEAKEWSPIESSKDEYPGVSNIGIKLLMDESIISFCEIVLQYTDVVTMGPGAQYQHEIPEEIQATFDVQSQLALIVNPSNSSQPYNLGVHQCSYPRVWSDDEIKLLRKIGLRLTKALEKKL